MKYVARESEHIQDDIKRNWSSWNFGQEGLFATEEQIDEWKEEAIANDTAFFISGMELWGSEIENADIRELYAGYWVLVDNVNASGGLSCVELQAGNIEEAITEADTKHYTGDGNVFNAEEYNLVYSCKNIHIFEIK